MISVALNGANLTARLFRITILTTTNEVCTCQPFGNAHHIFTPAGEQCNLGRQMLPGCDACSSGRKRTA
eukprot:5145458-Pleurochrysis_carterae.AAC.1